MEEMNFRLPTIGCKLNNTDFNDYPEPVKIPFLDNLLNNQPLKLHRINHWLLDNRDDFHSALEDPESYECKKWHEDNSKYCFSCNCPTRKDECVLKETYIRLEEYVQIARNEDIYIKLLEQYHKIQNSQIDVFKWLTDNKQYFREKHIYSSEIQIRISIAPFYYYEIMLLDKTEFPSLWRFKEVYRKHYYSEEYENYTNH